MSAAIRSVSSPLSTLKPKAGCFDFRTSGDHGVGVAPRVDHELT
jgi:hypothetical protein